MADVKSDLNGKLGAGLALVRSIITVAASCALLALFIVDFNSICSASQQLLARAGSLTSLKVLGVELNLDEESVSAALSEYAERPRRLSADVAKVISKLQPSEYVRLMEVGQLRGLCEFEKPTAKMREDVALDYALDEKGLTKIVASPKILADVGAYISRRSGEGVKMQNGRPLSCYDMTLTDLGRDVKTALVQTFKSAFDHLGGRGAPPVETRPADSHNMAAL